MTVTIQDIYCMAIEMGIDSDPRGRTVIEKQLKQRKSEYEDLNDKEKRFFDENTLDNPYSDTRILFGESTTPIKKVFMGIDIGVGELLLVDRLNEQGAAIDLVIAHHPEGMALNTLHDVMMIQADVFGCCGVPVNVAEHILSGEMTKTERGLIVTNYNQVVDAARLLNLPFVCIHTPADNLVQRFIEELLEARQPEILQDVLDVFSSIPEYVAAWNCGAGPKILNGQSDRRLGKIMVDMTGGTDAGRDIYSKLGHAGVGTLISMHMSEHIYDTLSEQNINIILAGHMSSDSIGMNLYLDKLESCGIDVVAGSGLTRHSRWQSHQK